MDVGARVRKFDIGRRRLFLGLSALIAALAVGAVFALGIPACRDPVRLMKYPRRLFVVLSAAACCAWGVGALFAVRWLSRLMHRKSKGAMAAAYLINLLATVLALAVCILSALTFSKRLGVVPISDYQELTYIRHYPSGQFALVSDIDCPEKVWKTIGCFQGRLEGNGHVIRGLTLGKAGFIRENRGVVQNCAFQDVVYSAAAAEESFGTLACRSYGEIRNCRLLDDPPAGSAWQGRLIGINRGTAEGNRGAVWKNECLEHTWWEEPVQESAVWFFLKEELYSCKVCGAEETRRSVELSAPTAWFALLTLAVLAVSMVLFLVNGRSLAVCGKPLSALSVNLSAASLLACFFGMLALLLFFAGDAQNDGAPLLSLVFIVLPPLLITGDAVLAAPAGDRCLTAGILAALFTLATRLMYYFWWGKLSVSTLLFLSGAMAVISLGAAFAAFWEREGRYGLLAVITCLANLVFFVWNKLPPLQERLLYVLGR